MGNAAPSSGRRRWPLWVALGVCLAALVPAFRWAWKGIGSSPGGFVTRPYSDGQRTAFLVVGGEGLPAPADGALYVLEDGAAAWRRVDSGPIVHVAATPGRWIVLVGDRSGAALRVSRDRGASWESIALPVRRWWYGAAVAGDGSLLAWEGEAIHRFDGNAWTIAGRLPVAVASRKLRDRQLITSVVPGGRGEDDLVLVNPFRIYRRASGAVELVPFSDGLPPPPPHRSGIFDVVRIDRLLIAAGDRAVYVRGSGDAQWKETRSGPRANDEPSPPRGPLLLCRGLVPSPWTPGAWILADHSDIREENGEGVVQRWAVPAAKTQLISRLAATSQLVVAGFYRATSDSAGLLLRRDGSSVPVRLPGVRD